MSDSYKEQLVRYQKVLASECRDIEELERQLRREQDSFNKHCGVNPQLASAIATASCMIMQMIIRIKSDKIINKYCE